MSSEARFSTEADHTVFVCNVHLVSGSFKDNNENHEIPGATAEARNKFKHTAMMGVMKQTVDKAALAKPQGQDKACWWFVARDFYMMEPQVAQLLEAVVAQTGVRRVL